ncbi:SKP1-like protein 9 [Dioscorea cayenensis subsp. rotundata]|uniref:SKP1-like protein n=1 Tax=Dioscorea cayennensis subsp. rotundata TaxID=55577 RepID=A0AB40B2W0_DIOCR|nr:SKP1-like protein 9 [Dioscorea cayenensis subsp. rotundata]
MKLRSSDGKEFIVDKKVWKQSVVINAIMGNGNFVDQDENDQVITVSNVTAEVLAVIIQYCNKHAVDVDVDVDVDDEEVAKWDEEFMKNIDINMHYKLILASDYLEIKSLFDLTCKTLGDMIKANNNSPQALRDILNIQNDFTPEEEEALSRENYWVS